MSTIDAEKVKLEEEEAILGLWAEADSPPCPPLLPQPSEEFDTSLLSDTRITGEPPVQPALRKKVALSVLGMLVAVLLNQYLPNTLVTLFWTDFACRAIRPLLGWLRLPRRLASVEFWQTCLRWAVLLLALTSTLVVDHLQLIKILQFPLSNFTSAAVGKTGQKDIKRYVSGRLIDASRIALPMLPSKPKRIIVTALPAIAAVFANFFVLGSFTAFFATDLMAAALRPHLVDLHKALYPENRMRQSIDPDYLRQRAGEELVEKVRAHCVAQEDPNAPDSDETREENVDEMLVRLHVNYKYARKAPRFVIIRNAVGLALMAGTGAAAFYAPTYTAFLFPMTSGVVLRCLVTDIKRCDLYLARSKTWKPRLLQGALGAANQAIFWGVPAINAVTRIPAIISAYSANATLAASPFLRETVPLLSRYVVLVALLVGALIFDSRQFLPHWIAITPLLAALASKVLFYDVKSYIQGCRIRWLPKPLRWLPQFFGFLFCSDRRNDQEVPLQRPEPD